MLIMFSPMKFLILYELKYWFSTSVLKILPFCINIYIFCVSPAEIDHYMNRTKILKTSKAG